MTAFLAVAALLAAAALAAVLLPLLKGTADAPEPAPGALGLRVLREQLAELENESRAGNLTSAQYAAERSDIERRALEEGGAAAAALLPSPPRTRLAAALGIAVLALATGLYLLLGSPLAPQAAPVPSEPQNAHAVTPQQIQAMVAKLADRLQEHPEDGEGWLMLARSYNTLGRYPEASAAFGRATSLLPADAQRLADYADTLAMAQGRRLQGEPEKIIRRALAADPRNLKALALAGSAAFERANYAGAAAAWRQALALVPADSGTAERLRASIADADARAAAR